jgi:hypothetical protein
MEHIARTGNLYVLNQKQSSNWMNFLLFFSFAKSKFFCLKSKSRNFIFVVVLNLRQSFAGIKLLEHAFWKKPEFLAIRRKNGLARKQGSRRLG